MDQDNPAPVILTIDDEDVIRSSIVHYLSDYDYKMLEADNGKKGLEIFELHNPDLVLVDLRMPEVDGLDVLAAVTKKSPETPIIVVSGMGTVSDVVEALRLGAWNYLMKPIDVSMLHHAIKQALERGRLIRENKLYQEHLEELVEKRTIELEKMATTAQKANRAKSDFLANISHELRTPLNSIQVMSHLLCENSSGNLTDKQVSFAGVINEAGNALIEVIDGIFDYVSIESGNIDINNAKLLMEPFISTLEEAIAPSAVKRGLEFVVDAQDKPDSLFTDSHLLHRICVALLDNAVKYTKTGRVTLQTKTKTIDDKHFLKIEFLDTGEGIAEDKCEQIFEAFEQADAGISRKHDGLGIGLSIAHRLTEMLGGELSVKSKLGRGSTFTLTLPIQNRK